MGFNCLYFFNQRNAYAIPLINRCAVFRFLHKKSPVIQPSGPGEQTRKKGSLLRTLPTSTRPESYGVHRGPAPWTNDGGVRRVKTNYKLAPITALSILVLSCTTLHLATGHLRSRRRRRRPTSAGGPR